MAALSYSEARAALDRALVFGINPSLGGITALCAQLGDPQDRFASVQITGTNGKTSTARITHAILHAHGAAAGLYTSPELERVNERIELGDGPVRDDGFAEAVSAALDAAEALRPKAQGTEAGFTEFELTTAAALWAFSHAGVEFAVLEVGMGGRWDATSVVSPAVAAITGVGLDHTAILGDTLELIAAEKAAIIKPGSTAVLGPGTAGVEHVFLEQSQRVGASCLAVREAHVSTPVAEDLTVRFRVLAGPDSVEGHTSLEVAGVCGDYGVFTLPAPRYQADNVATAIAVAEAAWGRALDADSLRRALEGITLPGRFELVRRRPPVVVDGSHNPQAALVLASAIAQAWPQPAARPTVVLGVLADKDATGIVGALAPVVSAFVVTEPRSARAMDAGELAAIIEAETGVPPMVVRDLSQALHSAMNTSDAGVVVTGSLTTAGQARAVLRDGSATA